MRRTLRSLLGAVGLLVGCCLLATDRPAAVRAEPQPAVDLKAVKYAELGDAIRGLRGKVVVVDLWADFCGPCKREFPRLVALHRAYADRGVVCVSVSLDPPESRDAALGFLRQKEAAFPNYWLDAGAEQWQQRFRIDGPPAVFVFDREGRRAAKFFEVNGDPATKWSYRDVDRLVQELLR